PSATTSATFSYTVNDGEDDGQVSAAMAINVLALEVELSETITFTDFETAITSGIDGQTFYFNSSSAITVNFDYVININNDITITNRGSGTVTFDGLDTVQIFTVTNDATVNLDNITFTRGKGYSGGAINQAPGTTLNINKSSFVNNTGTYESGAIHTTGTLNINDSSFSGNYSGKGAVLGLKGSTTTMTNSTIDGTLANGATPKHLIHAWGGTYSFDNVTIFSPDDVNIFWQNGLTYSISNSTIIAADGQKAFDNGKGTFSNSIIKGVIGGTIQPATNVWYSEGALPGDGNIDGTQAGNQEADLNLGPLADNGGPVKTMALDTGSIAIDAGTGTTGKDARGTDIVGTRDIGAFEYLGNAPSVLLADSQTVLEDNDAIGNVLSNDTDVDDALTVASFEVAGDTAVYTFGQTATITNVGTFKIEANGDYTFSPVTNWNGSAPQVTYTTNTGSTSTLDISVTPVNDPSVLVADSQTVLEDNDATGNVLTNDSDVDDVLTVASFQVSGDNTSYAFGTTATITGIGTVTIAANGNYTFSPVTDWNGTVPQVTYTTNSGSTSTLDISVTPVNEPSVLAPDSQTVLEDNDATGNVLSNDSDVDDVLTVASFQIAGDAAVYTFGQTASIVDVGTVTIAANGNYTFSPVTDWNGTVPQVT
ncbi:MAG: hypothetical protein HRT88_22325, partial [Lentisphaeraceae bacterium]|nr:hypothetical protein [Lentisphaeraceae bacterium]